MKKLFLFAALFAVAFAVDLVTVVRDFTPSHPDFEHYLGSQQGLVQSSLDIDGKPVFNQGSVITSSASFAQWYRDVDGVNMAYTRSMTLTEDSSRPGVWGYSNGAYFPVDGTGFGDYSMGHNFHFTTEIRTMFSYSGGEFFTFSGDDDVWVFINGRLAVDIGGVHGPQTGSVDLNTAASTLGISIGNNYELVIFQAERHTSGSTFSFETTLELTTSQPEIPAPGRPAYICEVMYPDFCAGYPQPAPGSDGPARQSSCPSDPVLHLNGYPYSFDNFNAVSFGNFYAVSGDVEGRTAIRGNLDLPFGQYSFGYELRTGGASAWDNSLPFSLVVGGDANYLSGQVYPAGDNLPYEGAREDMFIGGTENIPDPFDDRITGTCSVPGCLNNDFDNAREYYTLLQTYFDSVADNAIVEVQYMGLTLRCSDPSATGYSVHVTGEQISSITYWQTENCNEEAQIVFNIGGTGIVKFQGDNLYHRQEKVLYNVLGSGRTIQVETEVRGSILGPNNNYNQPGMGVVKGLVIVGNIQQAHQINRVRCVRPAPPPTDDGVCPEWETQCDGLNFPLGGSVHSFRDFGVISFGSFVADTGDVEGRVAVRYDFSVGAGYTVGYELRTANNQPDNSLPYSLVVGRDMCWISGSLHPDGSGIPHAGANEDAFVGGHVCSSTANYLTPEVVRSCGSEENAGCLNRYFDAALDCYEGYQNTLASLSDNVMQTVEWSALKLTCSDNSMSQYVVSLTPETMSQYTYITTDNCNFQASWVINVRGSGNVYFRGDSFPGVPGGIVWNIIGSGRIIDVTGIAVTGHILAPNNILHQTGGVIIGKVVVGDVTFSLQINKHNCPEPGTVPISTPTTEDAPALSDSLDVASLSLQSGDSVMILGDSYTVTAATARKKVFVAPNLNKNVPAGTMVTANVDGSYGRNPGTDEEPVKNVSSILSVSIALLVAIFALLF